MNFEKLLEWGAIIVVGILLIRWLSSAFSQSISTPVQGQYPYPNIYGPSSNGPGVVYLNPPMSPAWPGRSGRSGRW